jgi:hypothetical protein
MGVLTRPIRSANTARPPWRSLHHAEWRADVPALRVEHRHGNASDKVQAQASDVTDSYNNEGFAKAVEIGDLLAYNSR